jgi:hypothetical protein
MLNYKVYGEVGAAVTASDTDEFSPSIIYVGGAGNVTVRDTCGNAIVFTAVPAGTVLPVLCSGVNATNLTASNITRSW